MTQENKKLSSMTELAAHLGCTIQTIQTLKNKNKIPFYQTGRIVRFDISKVMETLEHKTETV